MALACTVRARNPQKSVEIRVGKKGNRYKSYTNSAAWLGLLACSVLNICSNFACIYHFRCQLIHLQFFCFFFPGHGTFIQRPLYLTLRPSHSCSASSLRWRRWSCRFRDTRYGGCRICPQQRQQWGERHSRRHRVRSDVRTKCAAASEHPIKTKAGIEHISATRGPVRRQPNVLPGGTHHYGRTSSRLGAQQQHVGWWFCLQL